MIKLLMQWSYIDNKPPDFVALYPNDKNIIALASNNIKQPTINRVLLDLNNAE